MSPEQFLQISNALREPAMLVASDGAVLAANQRARDLTAMTPDATLTRLEDIFAEDRAVLQAFLRLCSRSPDPAVTTLLVAAEKPARQFRCHGAMLSPRTGSAPARIMLTLTPQDASNLPFLALNQKLEELAREVERRQATEAKLQHLLRLSEFGREFGLSLSRSGALDEMLQRCASLLVEHLGAAFARIWVVDDAGETLVLRASAGIYTHVDGAHSRIPLGQLKIGQIAQSQQPHLTNQVVQDPRINDQAWASREGMVAFAGYPLIVDDTTVGVMAIFAKRPLSDSIISAMGSVASELAVGVSRKRVEDALREKAAALEIADARKNEFLAMLAHELRNPLAPIRSGLELLEGQCPDGDVLRIIQNQVEDIVRIVDDLLDVSRFIRGRIELRKHPVPLKKIVERSLATVQPSLRAAGHELVVTEPASDLWIDGDEVRLAQVATNLLHNAIKYTPRGGRIQVEIERVAAEVALRVVDNGIGIEPDFAPELFTLFSQASSALDRSQGGLGIGLTLVQQIVSLHGGRVAAASEGAGKGSVFTIYLPLTDARETPADAPPQEGDPATAYRVLVVDDNHASAKILARLIEKNWSHEIFVAFDGPQALATALARRPDIVFLDIGLPGMSGYEVAAALRQTPQLEHTMIVALTGYGADDDRRKSAAAGCDSHLVKPIGLDDLRGVFHRRRQFQPDRPR